VHPHKPKTTTPVGVNTKMYIHEGSPCPSSASYRHQPAVRSARKRVAQETTSGESSEEFDNTTSKEETGHDRQLWEEESDEEIIYHIIKKPYKRPETDNESEESFMINMGSGSGRDNPVRPKLVNEERLWRENFEARIWNAVNEMRHRIENNRKEVSEQWEVMQDIKT
jgi:hypothetical protein